MRDGIINTVPGHFHNDNRLGGYWQGFILHGILVQFNYSSLNNPHPGILRSTLINFNPSWEHKDKVDIVQEINYSRQLIGRQFL